MKLELKHLDFVNNGKVRLFNNLTLYSKDIDLQNCQLSFDGNKEPYLIHQRAHYYLDQIKPYKRSISQLTQEIEHDEVRFVPYDYFYDDPENDWFDGNVWLNYMFEGNTDKTDINFIPFYIVEKLQEWHFDIFNLIKAGLAIEMEAIPTTKPNIA